MIMPVRTNPCRTVFCQREATTSITVTYPDATSHTDEVCGPCARYYLIYSGTTLLDGATIVENDERKPRMTDKQREALADLCRRYDVEFDETSYHPQPDLPAGYVAGRVGPIYVGCDPEGAISS